MAAGGFEYRFQIAVPVVAVFSSLFAIGLCRPIPLQDGDEEDGSEDGKDQGDKPQIDGGPSVWLDDAVAGICGVDVEVEAPPFRVVAHDGLLFAPSAAGAREKRIAVTTVRLPLIAVGVGDIDAVGGSIAVAMRLNAAFGNRGRGDGPVACRKLEAKGGDKGEPGHDEPYGDEHA